MSTNWLTSLPEKPKVWIDTDIGNDIDDVLALLISLQLFKKENVVGISTTFYRPDQKARIARLILDELGLKTIPVYAGIGIYEPEKDGETLMKEKYGPFPVDRFGYPWTEKSLSHKEAIAYKHQYPTFSSLPVKKDTSLEGLKKAIETYNKDLIILTLGFHTNIAAVWDTIRKHKVNRIVVMGGWYEDEQGNVKRPGYNTGIDLQASRIILQQKDVNVLVVLSEFCKRFSISKAEYDAMLEKSQKVGAKPIGRAICEDMKVWMEGKNQEDSCNMIHISDPIATYLAYYPNEVKDYIPVEIQVNSYVPGITLYHPDSKKYVSFKKVTNSNIIAVKSVNDPQKMRRAIVDMVSRSLD